MRDKYIILHFYIFFFTFFPSKLGWGERLPVEEHSNKAE